MDVESIRRFCLCFPQATQNLQWGDDLCFKVGGKIFATLSLSSVPQRLSFKGTAERFAELVEHEGIIPAPYVGRYQWVALERLDVLPDVELKELIRESYEMVAAKARTGTKTKTKTKTKLTKTRRTNRRARKVREAGGENDNSPLRDLVFCRRRRSVQWLPGWLGLDASETRP